MTADRTWADPTPGIAISSELSITSASKTRFPAHRLDGLPSINAPTSEVKPSPLTRRHGLQHRHPESLIQGRKRKEGATGIEHAQVLQRHVAGKDHSLLQPRATDRLQNRFGAAIHPSDHHKVHGLP